VREERQVSERALDRLYLAASRGERLAQTRFYTALRSRLYVLVAQEMRRARFFLSAADIDDLVQELLIDAWRIDLGRYDPRRGSLMAFLRRKVRWRLIELVRRIARRRARQLTTTSEIEPVDPETTLTARDERGRREALGARARDALPELEPRAREAIERYDLGDEPLKDVARDLRVHPSSVTRARQRGLRELRAVLDEPRDARARYRDAPCTRSRSPSSSRSRPHRHRRR
jgi:RNA polymerase sigma factor (sigma-70 family)